MSKDWEKETRSILIKVNNRVQRLDTDNKAIDEGLKELAKQRTTLLKEIRELIENKWDKEFIMNSQYQSYELFILKKLERLADESK